jgi:glucose-6-phosphate 1-epimerase
VTTVDFRGTPAVRLDTPGGATAVVALHGAQLVSWFPPRGREWLFLSERAELAPGKAIRGGVPICFPQFAGLGPLPKHGLARTRPWRFTGGAADRVTLAFEPHAGERAIWPVPCRADYTVTLSDDRIALELAVENPGSAPLPFTAALHGYFAVGDVTATTVEGLRGVEYRDAADRDRLRVEGDAAVRIRGEVDRVYHAVPGPVIVRTPVGALRAEAEGFPDVVVWNPGAAKGDALPDLAPGAWREMLCVEAGAVRRPVIVPPGGRWVGRQVLVDLAG